MDALSQLTRSYLYARPGQTWHPWGQTGHVFSLWYGALLDIEELAYIHTCKVLLWSSCTRHAASSGRGCSPHTCKACDLTLSVSLAYNQVLGLEVVESYDNIVASLPAQAWQQGFDELCLAQEGKWGHPCQRCQWGVGRRLVESLQSLQEGRWPWSLVPAASCHISNLSFEWLVVLLQSGTRFLELLEMKVHLSGIFFQRVNLLAMSCNCGV